MLNVRVISVAVLLIIVSLSHGQRTISAQDPSLDLPLESSLDLIEEPITISNKQARIMFNQMLPSICTSIDNMFNTVRQALKDFSIRTKMILGEFAQKPTTAINDIMNMINQGNKEDEAKYEKCFPKDLLSRHLESTVDGLTMCVDNMIVKANTTISGLCTDINTLATSINSLGAAQDSCVNSIMGQSMCMALQNSYTASSVIAPVTNTINLASQAPFLMATIPSFFTTCAAKYLLFPQNTTVITDTIKNAIICVAEIKLGVTITKKV